MEYKNTELQLYSNTSIYNITDFFYDLFYNNDFIFKLIRYGWIAIFFIYFNDLFPIIINILLPFFFSLVYKICYFIINFMLSSFNLFLKTIFKIWNFIILILWSFLLVFLKIISIFNCVLKNKVEIIYFKIISLIKNSTDIFLQMLCLFKRTIKAYKELQQEKVINDKALNIEINKKAKEMIIPEHQKLESNFINLIYLFLIFYL